MKICSYCHTENADGSAYCQSCGARLSDDSFGDGQTLEQQYTTYLPQQNAVEYLEQDGIQYLPDPVAPPPKKSNTVLIVTVVAISVVVLLAIIGVIIHAVTSSQPSSDTAGETSAVTTSAAVTTESSTTGNGNITAAETTVTQSTTAAQGGIPSTVSDDAYNDMELLLSNLAETEVKDYSAANYSMETIISFSLLHRYINNSGGFQHGDPSTLPADAVKKDAKRFFNLTLTDSDMQEISLAFYNDSSKLYQYDLYAFDYYVQHTRIDYNASYVVAVPTNITQESGESYRVTFTIYQSASAIGDSEYTHRPGDAALTGRYTKLGTGTAVLQQYSGNEYSNYIVAEYHATY